jgi:hypothetical protein
MTFAEFVTWCAGGIVLGTAVGVVLAAPEEAFGGLRDALAQVGGMVVHGARGLWSWRP